MERNLNVNSVNTIGAGNNQYEGFGDGTDAIKTEEGLYKIMERDGGIKLKMDQGTEEPAMYEEMPIELQPRLQKSRQMSATGKAKLRKAPKKTVRFPEAKTNMKNQIVTKIEQNLYPAKKTKVLKEKSLKKNGMPKLTPQQEREIMFLIQQEEELAAQEQGYGHVDDLKRIPWTAEDKAISGLLEKQKRKYKQSI